MSHFLDKRLKALEAHLKAENPALLDVLPTFYQLDKILTRIGLMDKESSLAMRISWWPLISVLGTFSSGKSTFINDYVGEKLQSTGNQAVDDKFTVICYRSNSADGGHTLPGSALDADPRFPFFRISREIEKVAKGEGQRIESYLQLRTTNSADFKGKIIIDSPGFDADDQRRSTLRITDHIIDLSDLVLVFFDARHPEPGAMQDTLEHLVARTVSRVDASKFFYVLNQIDTSANEDNPEAVVGAWQRSIAQAGLTSGQFLTIYNEKASVPIEDKAVRERFRKKRDADLAVLHDRMDGIDVHRNYRIVGVLETVVNVLENDILPKLRSAKTTWRQRVIKWDSLALIGLIIAATAGSIYFKWLPPTHIFSADWILENWPNVAAVALAIIVMAVSFHYWVRGVVARKIATKLSPKYGHLELDLRNAFMNSTKIFKSIFRMEPAGWSARRAKNLRNIREALAHHIQTLNDRYADPSGKSDLTEPAVIEDKSAETTVE